MSDARACRSIPRRRPPTLLLQKTLEEEVISAIDVLNSRQVAETVVDTIGADKILLGELPTQFPPTARPATAP